MGKAQVTVFIIAGMVLLLVAAAFFLLYLDVKQEAVIAPTAGTPPFYVQSCLDQATKSVLLAYGIYGGGHEPTLKSISYGVLDDSHLFPTEKEMIADIKQRITVAVKSCIADGESVGGYIATDDPSVNLLMTQNMATVELDQPIVYKVGDIDKQRSRFRTQIQTRFLTTFQLINSVTEQYRETRKIQSIRSVENDEYTISYVPVLN